MHVHQDNKTSSSRSRLTNQPIRMSHSAHLRGLVDASGENEGKVGSIYREANFRSVV